MNDTCTLQYVALKERLVFSQFKCAEFKSEVSFFLQATDFMQSFIIIKKEQKYRIIIGYCNVSHKSVYLTMQKKQNNKM